MTNGDWLDRFDRRIGRLALAVLFIAAGFGLGYAFAPDRGDDLIGTAEASFLVNQTQETGGDGDYSFFTNRRYLWVVKRSTGQAQFFHVPETETSEQPMLKSRIYQIEGDDFPLDRVVYQVSERNLELFLWITNPSTGKVRFVRAKRDGGFEESPVVNPAADM